MNLRNLSIFVILALVGTATAIFSLGRSDGEQALQRESSDSRHTVERREELLVSDSDHQGEEQLGRAQLNEIDGPVAQIDNVSSIKWRERPLIGTSAVESDYDRLSVRALLGDANAAQKLGEIIQYCRQSGPPSQTNEEFDETIRKILEEHIVPVYDEGRVSYAYTSEAGGDINPRIAAILARKGRELCGGIPMENRTEASHWLDLAAELGGTTISAAQAARLGDIGVAEREWRAGDPNAIVHLVDHHHKQFNNGSDPAGLIRAFGYLLVLEQLIQDAGEQGFGVGDTILEYSSLIPKYKERLLPGQIREAEEIAEGILAEQENCCLKF